MRDRSLRRCEKTGSAVRAAGQTACPTLQPGHLTRRGAGGFACPPFFSHLLTLTAPKLAVLLVCAQAVCGAELRAGAASRVITPEVKPGARIFLAGFGNNRLATGVHDDLFARCLALSAGARLVVLCGVDSIGLFLEDVEKIRARVPGAQVMVGATHVHEAPDTMGLWGPAFGVSGIDEEYNALVIERTAEAAAEAVRTLKPARLRAVRYHSAELDGMVNDTRPPVVLDSELVMLSVTDRAGRPIGTVVNWANHPEALGSRNTEITSDYAGYLYSRLEERLGGVAVLLIGAIGGMQSPLGAKIPDPETGQPAPANSFRMAELIGRRVADLAADAVTRSKPVTISELAYTERPLRIPVTNAGYLMAAKADIFKGRKPMTADAGTSTVVGYLRLGPRARPVLEAAFVPGELYPELSVGGIERYSGADFPEAVVEPPLKQMMKAPVRMVVGLANDEIGYIIPKAEWDEKQPWLKNAEKRWYGEVNSVGPEAAPLIMGALRELIAGK